MPDLHRRMARRHAMERLTEIATATIETQGYTPRRFCWNSMTIGKTVEDSNQSRGRGRQRRGPQKDFLAVAEAN